MTSTETLLVVGEVFVDITLVSRPSETKMRLGGVVHAARALWASGSSYAMAAVCPKYLVDEVEAYVRTHGCSEFIWLGEILGAPNVIVIADRREVSAQGYEDILRDRRHVALNPSSSMGKYLQVLIFPGRFDLAYLREHFSATATFDFDVAYDVTELSALSPYANSLRSIITSTSSRLFSEIAQDSIGPLLTQAKQLGAGWLLLKENRGGSRLFDLESGAVEHIPAQLGATENSVGVGDAYSAIAAARATSCGMVEAAWRGAQVATRYAQSTYPDDLKRDIARDLQLARETIQMLWGTSLPWHDRPALPIYLAAPDFSYQTNPEIDRAVESLQYHNFCVRRPVKENGELAADASMSSRQRAFFQDVSLLSECAAVFAIPLDRDPGSLVEVGWAMARSIPVVVYDPRRENNNTMVVAGSDVYSSDMDECLNGLFGLLGQPRRQDQ